MKLLAPPNLLARPIVCLLMAEPPMLARPGGASPPLDVGWWASGFSGETKIRPQVMNAA